MKRDRYSPSTTRDVARRNKRGRKAYVMKSVKNGLEMRLESTDELMFAKMLDLDPRGAELRAQETTFDLHSGEIYQALPDKKDGRSRYYTPDLTNVVDRITCVYEVKPEKHCAANAELFGEVAAFCRKKGMRFLVLSKEHYGKVLMSNLDLLHQYARQCESQIIGWAEVVDQLVDKHGHVQDVLEALVPRNYYLIASILRGVLQTDIHTQRLSSMDFDVSPAYGDMSTLEVIRYA